MSGGRFVSMNKVRPGAYINFETRKNQGVQIGSRGIVTFILPLSWGKEQDLIEITGTDLLNGNSLAKIGLLPEDAEALPINLALQNCDTAKIYNPCNGGTRASVVIGATISYVLTSDTQLVPGKTYYTRTGTGTEQDPYVYTPVAEPVVGDIATYYEQVESGGTTITAKYPGTFGNKIAIVIKEAGTAFVVETYANGYAVDTQKVTTASELVANNYVTFTPGTLTAISSTLLSGGTNGASTITSDVLTAYFNALRATKWNTMAYAEDSNISSVVDFIREMREDEGKYVQAVVANYDSADYEGIINNVNGVKLEDDTSVSAAIFTHWVAGATAGADIIESITGKVVDGAISITGLLSNDEIIAGLQNGKFILSLNQNNQIKVEKDINSLHTFTADKSYLFSKNRIIRELDEIGSSVEDIWETTYLGKVSNNENGRTLFKSSIINYLTELQNKGAIEDFDSSSVDVAMGDDVDSVIVTIAIKPVDSMEFLYATITVEQ